VSWVWLPRFRASGPLGGDVPPKAKMIEYRNGDLLESQAEALVNAVNCVGVMGGGIALQFKGRFPGLFRRYADACRRGTVRPGHMFVFETGHPTPRLILNFPTKRHWRDLSRIEDIDAGLTSLVAEVRSRSISSIALPALGCGLGGLDWVGEVRPLVEGKMRPLENVKILVYESSNEKSRLRRLKGKSQCGVEGHANNLIGHEGRANRPW